jgi:hypothetical protein
MAFFFPRRTLRADDRPHVRLRLLEPGLVPDCLHVPYVR